MSTTTRRTGAGSRRSTSPIVGNYLLAKLGPTAYARLLDSMQAATRKPRGWKRGR